MLFLNRSVLRLKSDCVFEQEIDIPNDLIEVMHKATQSCLKAHPELYDHPYLCENVYWTPLQDRKSATIHTHTIKGVDYPSHADIDTTQRLKKENLCIINTTDRTVTCYNKHGKGKRQKRY